MQTVQCTDQTSPAPVGQHQPSVRAPCWLVEPFDPISLAQLNAKAGMLERRDNKYVIDAGVLRQAVGELVRHFDILEIDGKRDFTYDTCYFDDAGYSTYFDHHQGRRIRAKIRMRKYVDANLCFVEIKLKHMRGMTIKERLQRPAEMHGTLDEEAQHFVETSWRNLYGREFGRRLEPALRMRYQRVTLVARHGGERMTVDLGAVFEGGTTTRRVSPDLYLVETKSDNANGIADKILRELHQHPTNSCSKYCVALAALNKARKYNKFLVPLRRLGMLPHAPASDPVPVEVHKPVLLGAAAVARLLAAVLVGSAALGLDAIDATRSHASAAPAAARVSRFVLPPATVDGIPVAEISGLAWDADEQRLYGVSDRGYVYHFRVESANGTLESVAPVFAAALADPAARDDRSHRFNAEGLAVRHGDDGRRGNSELVVALEQKPPRLARFSPEGRLLGALPVPPPADAIANYRKKGRGLESAGVHPRLGILTAPESPLRQSPPSLHTVYARGHAWSFAHHADGSRLKGLELLPDGDLLVLERTRPEGDKRVQIPSLSRVHLASCGADAICRATLLVTLPAGPENFEGLTLLDARHALIASDNGGDAEQGSVFSLITLP